MKLSVLDKSGKSTGREVVLPEDIFAVEPNDHAIYLDVKQYLANQRQGTHKAKEKSEVSGSTRKLKKQKGTGGARAGSIKSPTIVGGARAFGPRPRDYGFKLNIKLKALARKSALSYKAKAGSIKVIESISFAKPKTKDFAVLLNSLAADTKALFVLGDTNENFFLSSRNLPKANVVLAKDLNTYQVMNSQVLLLEESSVKVIQEILTK